MEYNLEFKSRVFQIFRWRKDFKTIIRAIESDRHNQVRLCIEEALDDPALYMRDINRGKKIVVESKKHAHQAIKNLYSDFMFQYEKFLDDDREKARPLLR
jgi:hypothetical protein